MRAKQRATLRKLLSLPQLPISPDKILLRLWNKTFFREVCKNIQIFGFKVLQGSSSLASGNGAVQMFFLTPNRNMFPGKFVNWEIVLAVFWEHFVFNFKRVEIVLANVFFFNFLSSVNLGGENFYSAPSPPTKKLPTALHQYTKVSQEDGAYIY